MNRVENGYRVVVNGDEAAVLLRPSEDVQQVVGNRIRARLGQQREHEALRGLSAETKDGVRVDGMWLKYDPEAARRSKTDLRDFLATTLQR